MEADPAAGVFTFHYVSITTESFGGNVSGVATLHSTMSLLLLPAKYINHGLIIFTFHYVSITTQDTLTIIIASITALHSTMSLLLRFRPLSSTYHHPFFTFHYVSITTAGNCDVLIVYQSLHSTMSLLLRCGTMTLHGGGSTLHSTMSLLLPW